MEKGFIFEYNKHFYFIKTNKIKKCKTIAQHFLDFFISRYNGNITQEIMQKTYNLIYSKMYSANIRRSDDFEWYFIHTSNSGVTISENDIIFIEI